MEGTFGLSVGCPKWVILIGMPYRLYSGKL